MTASAGMGFYLDREGHKTFLRVATNKELEAESTALKAENEQVVLEIDSYYQDKVEAESESVWLQTDCDALQGELGNVKKHWDRLKIAHTKFLKELKETRDEKGRSGGSCNEGALPRHA